MQTAHAPGQVRCPSPGDGRIHLPTAHTPHPTREPTAAQRTPPVTLRRPLSVVRGDRPRSALSSRCGSRRRNGHAVGPSSVRPGPPRPRARSR
eukprot:scaffold83974_cov45-Phaeocystis_antarctica.AAC.2